METEYLAYLLEPLALRSTLAALLCNLGAYQMTVLVCLKKTGSREPHLRTPPNPADRQLYHIASISSLYERVSNTMHFMRAGS